MSERMPNLVPASIQRVRRFLAVHGGMRVEPWAGAGETLDALHDALASHRGDDAFWREIASLLDVLGGDLGRRIEAREGSLVENEVLDPERREALLVEIRSALEGRGRGRGGFQRLASALSVPAAGLLLVIGGAVTLGCEEKDGTSADATTETSPDSTGDPKQDVGCSASIEQMLDICVEDPGYRSQVTTCLAALDSSWRTGLAEALACEDCDAVLFHLQCLTAGLADVCDDPSSAGTFDLETFVEQCSTPVYLGLRFE